MNIDVKGIGEVVLTLQGEAAIAVGDWVVMKENATAKKAPADADPIGICVSRNGDYIGVQVKGGVAALCTDGTLTVGYSPIKTTAAGGIAKATTGVPRFIVAVDTAAKTAAVLL